MNKANENLKAHPYHACLLGLAMGDALGAPLTGMKPGHVRQVYGEITDYVDAAKAREGKPHRWTLRGLYTNNTQRALALADILARDGRCDPRAFADVLVEMAEAKTGQSPFGCHRRVSRNFQAALERMRDRHSAPLDCGGPSPACGAAARVAPVALFYADRPDDLARAVIETSLVTHRDPRAVAAALAVARAIAASVAGEDEAGEPAPTEGQDTEGQDVIRRISRIRPIGPRFWDLTPPERAELLVGQVRRDEALLLGEYGRHLVARAADGAARSETAASCRSAPPFCESLALLPRLLEEGDDALAFESIVREANRCAPERPVHDPSEGFSVAATMTALYLALGNRGFLEAMGIALGLGRDAHDLGAMVGAIAAPREGIEAIPGHLIAGLRNSGQIRLRAENLLTGAIDYSAWRGIIELESEATAAEERERRRLTADWDKAGLLVKPKPRARPAAEPPMPFAPPPDLWLRSKEKRERERLKAERKADRGEKRKEKRRR